MRRRTFVCQACGVELVEQSTEYSRPAIVGDMESWRKRCKDRNAISAEAPRMCSDLLAALRVRR